MNEDVVCRDRIGYTTRLAAETFSAAESLFERLIGQSSAVAVFFRFQETTT